MLLVISGNIMKGNHLGIFPLPSAALGDLIVVVGRFYM